MTAYYYSYIEVFTLAMIDNKKKYEISFILGKDAGEGSIIKILAKYDALPSTKPEISRIKLSFPIKKENYGRFGSFSFEGNPESLKEMGQELGVNPDILRFSIAGASAEARHTLSRERLDRKAFGSEYGARTNAQTIKTKEERRPAAHSSSEAEKKSREERQFKGELSNEALEKKLEEILK